MRIRTSSWEETRGSMVSQSDYKLFGFTYNCDVKYKYEVDGKFYYGTRTDNWESGTNPGLCKRLSEYDEDDEFVLFYDPLNPSESVINNKLDPFYYSFLIVVSMYDLFEAIIYFDLSEMVQISSIIFPMFIYMLVSVLSVLWVGISNIQEEFASSLLAICGSLYFSAVIVKGLHSGYNMQYEVEEISALHVV